MRQLSIRAPQGCGEKIYHIAQEHDGVNLSWTTAIAVGETVDDVQIICRRMSKITGAKNFSVALEPIPDLHDMLRPQGVMLL